jgi:hypothetical protein
MPTSESPSVRYALPFLHSGDRAAHEEIQHRAYARWESDGHRPGRDLENWLAAEAEVVPPDHVTRAPSSY